MVLKRSDPQLPDRLLPLLSRGGVTILPCDTIYGFVGRVPETEARIRAIKGRGETNPFLVLIGSVVQAEDLAAGPIDKEVTKLWPGPLTVVIRTRDGTLAVRYPDDPFLTEIIRSLDGPVYSTSVNRTGSAPLWRINEIVAEFESDVDMIVDDGDFPAGLPSTILDITTSPYRILRQGAFQVPRNLLERT
ncbi:MAG TPA: L-threonylcarbamoyladenylate synthase [Spirochaetia bacterium]|nr:L-threonylcarbamoyladenylate synthase [Spirochaetia bacterium]